jgi:DMSO/TMAO reductase YedYZ molybdopterin-dependent catalytic subunit
MSEGWRSVPTGYPLDRRRFLRSTAAAVPILGAIGWWEQRVRADAAAEPGGLIVRQKDPLNLEFPFASLDSFITPNEKFYVRNHFSIPKLEAGTWKLKVEGAVKKELELSYDQIRKLPSRTVTATLECAGNNRAYLTPKAKGVQWELGAISNAEWTGVPLGAVLEEAGLDAGAVEVVLEGADRGAVGGDIRPANPVLNFARSLPLTKARKPEVLLAYRMNGQELPVNHGFPLRAVVAGWYGMASIKWLQRLVVTKEPFNGFFQTIDYSYFTQAQGLAAVLPIQELQVKATIAGPTAGATIKAGTDYKVHGAAWAGESDVRKVEVSVDGGQTWNEARLGDRAVHFAWRFWEYAWRTPAQPGSVTLLARATDTRGNVQPLKRDPNRRNYLITHALPVEVTIK